jgi:hypothetical protein
MKVLLISCCLYLFGVVVLLFIKPKLMFDEHGNWKEFGFSEQNHTWFPFWLFCIIWGILSYFLVNYFISETETVATSSIVSIIAKKKGNKNVVVERETIREEVEVMKPGYYALDKETTSKEGFPKYVYIGPKVDE